MKTSIKLLMVMLIGAASCIGATPYVGTSVGFLVDSTDPIASARIGWDLVKKDTVSHSIEAEVMYSHSNEYGIKFDILPLMVNYRLSVDTPSKLVVSLGGGVGATRSKLTSYYFSDNDFAFTYQLFGSLGYKLSQRVELQGSVRYLNIGEAKIGSITADVGDDTSLELGLKLTF